MISSLSIAVPVCNFQHEIDRLVGELLETAAEMTSRFEVLIVDVGSHDDTSALAAELARKYPQVRLIHLPGQVTDGAALSAVLEDTQSDAILLRPRDCGTMDREMIKLWQWIAKRDVVLGVGGAAGRSSLGRAARYFSRMASPVIGMRLLRRRAALWLQDAMHMELAELMPVLEAADFRYEVLELAQRSEARMPSHKSSGVSRPKFLQRLTRTNRT